MKKYILSILFFYFSAAYSVSALAMPLGNIHVVYWENSQGKYTYFMMVNNAGPIAADLTTSNNHTITNWQTFPPTQVPAGDKLLDEDENFVVFGLDTRRDDITISNVITLDSQSIFHGQAEPGFEDSDGNGVPNQTVGWHLPFNSPWDLNDTIKPGDWITVMFTLSEEVEHFDAWVGGSDDANIWNVQSTMLEDEFGIYDADNGIYLASFLTRKIQAIKF
ncbi:hypothetical protein MNBD_GAMMA17-816 [hydrothermal vent metagenome]|uniref:Uncharacterized protein n=1 Tax=hydrothermal vent metagenome TaxID=652676 RepID=A0A3B0ZKF1_9ZZZZ